MLLLMYFSKLQTKSVDNTKLEIKLKELRDYFMTDAVSRASPTMAKCISAVNKQNSKEQQRAVC